MKRPSMTSSNPNSSNNNPPAGNVIYDSYQRGGNVSSNAGYQPPLFYASDQTAILNDATKTFYQTDEVAGRVLDQLTSQRQQILHAGDDVFQMQNTAQIAKKELEALRMKYRRKKQQLYMWIVILSVTDLLLFLRMIQCHGNFYCW
jgi:hypothetical protein